MTVSLCTQWRVPAQLHPRPTPGLCVVSKKEKTRALGLGIELLGVVCDVVGSWNPAGDFLIRVPQAPGGTHQIDSRVRRLMLGLSQKPVRMAFDDVMRFDSKS